MKGRAAALALTSVLVLSIAVILPADAAMKAWLDRSQIAEGDTVRLTLEHEGRTSGQPDLAPLQSNFDILGTSTSTNIELVNGSFSENTEVALTLAPKRDGRLTVPPLTWDGSQSSPLALTVTGPGSGSQSGATGAASLFITSHLQPQDPYVQAAVRLTVRLYTSRALYRPDLELNGNANVMVKQVGSDQDSAVERNGRSYRVITRHYVLFPLHSGKLSLPGPVLDAEISVGRGGSAFRNPFQSFLGTLGTLLAVKPIRVFGRNITLDVRPRPASAIGSYWLPARKVTLSAHWDQTGLATQAGDPLTLNLYLQATGLTAAQLPDLAALLDIPSGLKAYPDQATLIDNTQDDNLVGSRDQSIALIANAPGRYTIPALKVRWWDTATHQLREATLPAQTLHIMPAPASAAAQAAATPAPQPASASPPGATPPGAAGPGPPRAAGKRTVAGGLSTWEWSSIGLAALWLLTLGGWLWSRRAKARVRTSAVAPVPRTSPRPDAATERAAFRAACHDDDPLAARRHLLAWAAALWGSAPAGLNAVAARAGDARTADLLRDLDRACYAGGAWSGQPLAAALTQLPDQSERKSRRRDGLEPLYP
jgi:hypothetical protein